MIVLVGGKKGGTGKSTISTNLAALRVEKAGHKNLLLIDTDSQGSTADWAYYRKESGKDGIECIQLFEKRIVTEIDSKAKRYEDIIIDAGGRDSKELRYSMTVADVMLVPVGASQYDLNTIVDIDELLEQIRTINPDLTCYVVINNFPNHAKLTEGAEGIEFLKQFDNVIPIEFIIHHRISFNRTAKEGLGVNELTNNGTIADPKALDEITKLYEVIYHE
ncbi:AAA family ATPase [Fodinibius sediminis]|uniref:Chromosome partitioning protein n=1 Tax=Fodinibius sediminis TaxID=1214077 RepID=A0A521FDW9_9BACT|nr:AAA family ATPase [Fodinibius sediminis]SMO94376.1 chromosome partitioning protein [Fodinibius sediminis]